MSISAPTGFGKTYGALLIAHGITGDWSKIAVIDTENKSASLYAHLGAYYTIPIEPPFTTDKYIQAIDVCEKGGIEVIIIDSTTHVWKGEGGLLEHNNNLGGRYQDWAKTTPLYQKWLNRILHSSAHVICTTRKKQAYAMIQEGNKTKVEKKGLEDEIRDGFDFEMTIAFEVVNENHLVRAAKDRTQLFDGKPEFLITEETGRKIKAWCEMGVDAGELERKQKEEKEKALQVLLKNGIAEIKKAKTIEQLTAVKNAQPKEVVSHVDFKAVALEMFNALQSKTDGKQSAAGSQTAVPAPAGNSNATAQA